MKGHLTDEVMETLMCLEAPGVKARGARGGKGQEEAGGGCCGKQTENKMYNSTKKTK